MWVKQVDELRKSENPSERPRQMKNFMNPQKKERYFKDFDNYVLVTLDGDHKSAVPMKT
jgi:hypothetical protein